MRIVSIHINDFGPIRERTFDFNDALTIIRGDNESGKSSLLLFIKFALYGLSKRAPKGGVSETDRAINHETGIAHGTMTVSSDGKLYRIDRQLTRTPKNINEKVQLTELSTKNKCDYGNSIGEFFLGIPAEIFENSCGISQLTCSSVKGEQLGAAIRNILSSADESIDYEKALRSLDTVRKKYSHKNNTGGGSIQMLTKKAEELNAAYLKAVDDNCETERIEAELKKLDATIADVSEKQKIADELASKINLRTVIKLFDKLHEYEDEQKNAQDELYDVKAKLTVNGKNIDRPYLAELTAAKNELLFANAEKNKMRTELDVLLSSADKEAEATLRKLERWGGLETLCAFRKKTTASVKFKSAIGAVSAVSVAAFAALPFAVAALSSLLVPFLAVSAIFAVLSVVFFIGSGNTKKKAKAKCAELDTDYTNIDEFISAAKNALAVASSTDIRAQEIREVLSIKEKVLSSAKGKCADITSVYGAHVSADASFEEILSSLETILLEATSLCDRRDALTASIGALTSSITSLSAELSDYNEHQTRHKVSDKILAMTNEEIQTAKKEKSFHDLQLKALGEKKLSAERALLERRYTTKNPFDIAAELARTEEQLKAQNERLAALVLAIETIEAASVSLRSTVAPKLYTASNDYMSRLTDGKYDSVAVSDSLDMSMSEGGFSYPIDAFSTGTKDLAYLSLRLSLLGLLGEDEVPPLLMDETLAMMDDNRAKRVLKMLSEHTKTSGQCIIFCCHDREERLCQSENIEFSSIEM